MLQKPNRVQYVPDPNKFDLQTHAWDSQGHLVKRNLYRSHIIGDKQYFERPVNSGNLFFANNKPAGRMEYTFGEDGKIAKKELKLGAPHVEYTAPLDGADKLHYELEQTKAKNSAAEAELAAIRAEVEALRKAVEAKSVPNMAPQASAAAPATAATAATAEQRSPTLTKRGV